MRVLAVAIAAVVALAFVIIRFRGGISELPEPTGSYRIGSTVVSLPWANGPAREPQTVQIWYPTDAASGKRAPYAYRLALPLRDRLLTAFVRTAAIVDAPVAPGRRPVILYVPGLGGHRASNSALLQELASYGFIVVAVDDTRPDGGFDFSSETASRRSLLWGDYKVSEQVADLRQSIDALTILDGDRRSSFAGKLDLARVGVVGFSFGGAVAAEAAVRDKRVVAAVNLDGWIFGRALRDGVGRPFMLMSSDPSDARGSPAIPQSFADESSFDRYDTAKTLAGLRRRGGYVVGIDGFGHYNFTDAALLPSVRRSGMGPIAPTRGFEIVCAYVRSFFGRYLRDDPAANLGASLAADSAVKVARFGQSPNRSIEHDPTIH